MGTAVFDKLNGVCAPSDIGTLGAFFQPSPESEKSLVRADERLIRELVSVLDRQLIAAVDAQSVAEFASVRRNVMKRYVRALRALHDTVINLVSSEVLETIVADIIVGLAGDLEKQRESRFGEKLTDQAVFTLFTIRKISALARYIGEAGDVAPDKRQIDIELLREYHSDSLWAQFHLDVLFAAMKFDRPICESIRNEICEGLRASVNAYVVMKDALALRIGQPKENGPALILPWDHEDDELLSSSMKDIHERPLSEH